MIATTDHLLQHDDRGVFAEALRLGWDGDGEAIRIAHRWADLAQQACGLRGGSNAILSPPEHQHKLGMAETPSYGITLYHETMLTETGLAINSCPNAGDCRRLCVVENSFGGLPEVQLAWRWRTNLLVHHPYEFFVMLGNALRKAVVKHGRILVRPNVNSDIEWHKVVPTLVDGSLFEDSITFYDYTKNHQILTEHPSGWPTWHYRVSYSWNERSAPHSQDVARFLIRGGSVAVVTDRRRDEPVSARTVLATLPFDHPLDLEVFNADDGDEWMLHPSSAIGDLSLKPRTKALREFGERSDFVVSAYHPRLF